MTQEEWERERIKRFRKASDFKDEEEAYSRYVGLKEDAEADGERT